MISAICFTTQHILMGKKNTHMHLWYPKIMSILKNLHTVKAQARINHKKTSNNKDSPERINHETDEQKKIIYRFYSTLNVNNS